MNASARLHETSRERNLIQLIVNRLWKSFFSAMSLCSAESGGLGSLFLDSFFGQRKAVIGSILCGDLGVLWSEEVMCGLGWLCREPQACSGLSKFLLVSDKPKGPGLGQGTQERTKIAESAWRHRQHLILCNSHCLGPTASWGKVLTSNPDD